MKKCNRCQIVKTNEEFNVRHYKSGIVGLKSKCKKCRHEERMAWRATNPEDNARNKAYNKAHADEIRGKKLVKNYWPNLTWQQAISEWDRMHKVQGGTCAFCTETKRLHVDHCHATGKVRGLLCYNCNNGLGRFKDNIETLNKAIKYLQST